MVDGPGPAFRFSPLAFSGPVDEGHPQDFLHGGELFWDEPGFRFSLFFSDLHFSMPSRPRVSALPFPGIGPSFSFPVSTSTAGGCWPSRGPVFRMFCPSFLPFHEVVPACFLGGVFLLFRGVFRGVCLPKLLFSCYSATQIWGFFGLPRLFLLSGDGFRNLAHSDLRRRSIYICLNKLVSGVWFYGLRARTHRITMSNVE